MKNINRLMEFFFIKRTKIKRTIFYVLTDGLLLSLALYLSFHLRFDGNIEPIYIDKFPAYLLVFLAVKYSMFSFFRLYRMTWSYVGFFELLDILKANLISLFILMGIIFMLWHQSLFNGFPRSIPLIDFAVSLFFIVMFRTSRRAYLQARNNLNHTDAKRTLIIGAGNAGEQIVRDMRRQEDGPYLPVGFIDDDSIKYGDYIQGVKVYGTRNDISYLVKKLNIDTVLIAIPSASSSEMRDILSYVRKSQVKEIKTIPGLNNILDEKVTLSDIKEIQIEDLVGREQILIDNKTVSSFIMDKKILITGAGGSIGSELVKQVLVFNPEKIIALDIDETELYHIELELNHTEHPVVVPVVADVCNKNKIQTVFNEHLPDIVFHAAAYKHVPMMEKYPEEAINVNILGTKNVAEAAIACGAYKFVFVSTDKAVKPVNIMGASKQVAEKIVGSLNSYGMTKFTSVRFGNVIGSRGSVIQTFQKQIQNGRPLTVTDKDMKRYFMSIPEACILIMQAAAMGSGGEVFHLDMGEQVKIVDIARELIHLNNLRPDIDVPIVYTGIRPGEKLYEELLADSEYAEPTKHPKIFRGKDTLTNNENILQEVMRFEGIIQERQWAWIRNLLFDLVPSYNPSYQQNKPNNIYRQNINIQ